MENKSETQLKNVSTLDLIVLSEDSVNIAKNHGELEEVGNEGHLHRVRTLPLRDWLHSLQKYFNGQLYQATCHFFSSTKLMKLSLSLAPRYCRKTPSFGGSHFNSCMPDSVHLDMEDGGKSGDHEPAGQAGT